MSENKKEMKRWHESRIEALMSCLEDFLFKDTERAREWFSELKEIQKELKNIKKRKNKN